MTELLIQLIAAITGLVIGYVVGMLRYKDEADDLRDELELIKWRKQMERRSG